MHPAGRLLQKCHSIRPDFWHFLVSQSETFRSECHCLARENPVWHCGFLLRYNWILCVFCDCSRIFLCNYTVCYEFSPWMRHNKFGKVLTIPGGKGLSNIAEDKLKHPRHMELVQIRSNIEEDCFCCYDNAVCVCVREFAVKDHQILAVLLYCYENVRRCDRRTFTSQSKCSFVRFSSLAQPIVAWAYTAASPRK